MPHPALTALCCPIFHPLESSAIALNFILIFHSFEMVIALKYVIIRQTRHKMRNKLVRNARNVVGRSQETVS